MTNSNNTSRRLWVLGAADPEMQAISGLLADAGEASAYATVNGGRVHPGNAYKSDGFAHVGGSDMLPFDEIFFVECQVAGDLAAKITVVDHHRPDDPGYGKGSEEFLPASSLGQVMAWLASRDGGDCASSLFCDMSQNSLPSAGKNAFVLTERGWEWDWADGRFRQPIRNELILVAAADHCLEAAYRGRCPGVDPDELMQWRAASRAAFQKRTVADVLADVQAAREILKCAVHAWTSDMAPDADRGDGSNFIPVRIGEFADLRGRQIPELPEAAAREGIPFLSTVKDRDGREKAVLMAASPELIDRFLAGELVPGLVEYYGDRARGFAGGYLTAAK